MFTQESEMRKQREKGGLAEKEVYIDPMQVGKFLEIFGFIFKKICK